jgi:probable HAF family extracellular repeat protein
VVGSSSGKSAGTGGAFLSNGHGMHQLSAPAFAYGINDSGQIAGQSRNSMFLQAYPCVVSSNGAVTELTESNPAIECLYINTIIGPDFPATVAINNNGQMVGTSETSAGAEHGFSWSNGTMTDLGSRLLAGRGQRQRRDRRRAVRLQRRLQNLNSLIPAGSGYQIPVRDRDQRRRPDRRQRHRHRHWPDPRPAAEPKVTIPLTAPVTP